MSNIGKIKKKKMHTFLAQMKFQIRPYHQPSKMRPSKRPSTNSVVPSINNAALIEHVRTTLKFVIV